MTAPNDSPGTLPNPLDVVIADYLQHVEAGDVPDRDALFARHPALRREALTYRVFWKGSHYLLFRLLLALALRRSPRLLRLWLAAATADGTRSAVIDLSAVNFMSAAALHAICDEQERLLAREERLTVVCHHPQLRALFKIVELERVLDVVPTRAAAAAAPADELPPEAG